MELFKKFQNRHGTEMFNGKNVKKRVYTIMPYFVNQE